MKWLQAAFLFVAITQSYQQELGPPGPPGPPGDPGSCDCGGIDVRETFILLQFEVRAHTRSWHARDTLYESAEIFSHVFGDKRECKYIFLSNL